MKRGMRKSGMPDVTSAGMDAIFPARQEPAMPVVDDEDRPKKKLAHEIGQDLALLSVEELRERIGLLRDEIARLEAAMNAKQAQRSAADQFFKR
jgi:uncharacterized small protein (DUF1192 family)